MPEIIEMQDLGRSITEQFDDMNRRISEAALQVGLLQGAGGLLEPLSNVAGYNQVGLNAADPTLAVGGVAQATFVGQAQLLLAGEGVTFTQPSNSPYLRISTTKPLICIDYVVDTSGNGTHTTLASAMADAITAQVDTTIFICDDLSEQDIECGGMGDSQNIAILSWQQRWRTITAATSDMFVQTTDGGGGAGSDEAGLFFQNIGLVITTSGKAVARLSTGDELRNVSFEHVHFPNSSGFGVRNAGALEALGNVIITFRSCDGSLQGFFSNVNSTPPDQLLAFNNHLSMSWWWINDPTDADTVSKTAADFSFVQGGHYTINSINQLSRSGNNKGITFKDFVLFSGAAGAHFKTPATKTNLKGYHFSNIKFHATNNATDFGDFQGPAANPQDNLYVVGIHGVVASGVVPTGTFLTVDTDQTNPYIADIWAPDWPTVYSGPTITPAVPPVIDHGALTGLTDDDHTQYALLAGRAGGQTLIGGTAASEALTLQSTAHATKGNVIIADGTLVINAQDAADEGGEIQLLGSGANAAWTFDNYIGRTRLHSGGSEYFSFRTTGLEVGPITAAAALAVGGPIVANAKVRFDGTVTDASDHVFAIYFGAVTLDPGDTKNAYGLYGGGTVLATAGDTVANTYAMYAEAQAKSSTGAITNAYGLYITAPTIGDVLNIGLYNAGQSILAGTVQWVTNLYKGNIVTNVDLSVKRPSLGGVLAGDDGLAFFEHTTVAGGTDLGGFGVFSVTGHTRARPSGAGSVIGGEFIADVGANAAVFTGDVRGVYGRANVFEAGGGKVIPAMYAVLGDIGKSSFGAGYTVTDAYSGYFATPDPTNIGTITNAWALYAEGTNALRGLTEFGDANFWVNISVGSPIINYDANDFMRYSRALNRWDWNINSIQKLLLSASAFIVGVDGSAPTVTLSALDGVNSGGRLIFNGAAANTDWYNYNLAGAMQWWNPTGTRMTLSAAGQLAVGTTGSGAGILIGGDVQLYRSAANILTIPDLVNITGQLRLPTTGSGAGILVGGDVLMYRSAANVLTINDAVTIEGTTTIQHSTLGSEVLRLSSNATNDDPRESVYQHRATTTNAADTRVLTIPITASKTYMITMYVTARRTGGAAGTADDGAAYIIQGAYTTKSGTVTLLGALNAELVSEDQAAWAASMVINGANVQLQVFGAVDNNITWHVTARVWEVGS